MRVLAFALILLSFALAGCGGNHDSPSAVIEDVPIRLVASDEGMAAFAGTATLPDGANATPGTLSLASARRYTAVAEMAASYGYLSVGYSDAQGHLLGLQFGQSDGPLRAGQTFDFATMTTGRLDYEEDGTRNAFRQWTARGGSLTVDTVTEDAVTAHVSGAKMVAGTIPRCGDADIYPDGCVQNGAQGDFSLDVQLVIPRPKGEIDFQATGTDFDTTAINTANGTFGAYSNAKQLGLMVSEITTGRSINLTLQPASGSMAMGDTFTLGKPNSGSVVDYGRDGAHFSRIWKLVSGTATVRAIHGRLVTLELADAHFIPQERAEGTVVANGTVTVFAP